MDSDLRALMFGDYMDPDLDPRPYDEVTDFDELNVRMDQALKARPFIQSFGQYFAHIFTEGITKALHGITRHYMAVHQSVCSFGHECTQRKDP